MCRSLGLKTNHAQKKGSLDLELQVCGLSTPRQWIPRFDHLKYTLQQASMNNKMT
jgi:hypothetical protein